MKKKNYILLIVIIILAGTMGFLIGTLSASWSCPKCSFDGCKDNANNAEIVPLVNEQYFGTVLNEINNAKSTIDIVLYEFKWYTTNNTVIKLRDSLIDAKERGVNIRIILDQSKWYGEITDLSKENQKTAEYLASKGIEAKMDSEKITTHDKLIIIDNETTILGSHNWGSSALTHNNEASIMIKDSGIAGYYENYFEFLWENA